MEQRKDYVETQIEMLTNALKKLLDKVKKLKSEDNIQKVFLDESILAFESLSLKDLLAIEDKVLIQTLLNDHNITNEQIKILGDILFEYSQIEKDKKLYSKTRILYMHYQEKEIKTIDFIIFSRLAELETRIKESE